MNDVFAGQTGDVGAGAADVLALDHRHALAALSTGTNLLMFHNLAFGDLLKVVLGAGGMKLIHGDPPVASCR